MRIQYAKDVFETIEKAKAEGKGVVALRGKMIDAPIVARAKRRFWRRLRRSKEEDRMKSKLVKDIKKRSAFPV